MKKKLLLVFSYLTLLLFYVSSVFFIKEIYYYNSSKSIMTYIVYGVIILTVLLLGLFTYLAIKNNKLKKTKRYVIYFIFITLFIAGELFVSYSLNKISSSLSKITNEYSTYSSSLITLKETNSNNLNNLKIGIIGDTNNIEGHVIPNEMLKEEKITRENLIEYDTFQEMLKDLYDKKIDASFVSSSYASMFSNEEGLENIKNDTKVILEKEKKIKKDTNTNKTLTEPFSVLVMGVDSTKESLASSSSLNGDALMLMTFNPNTMNATILSIPRDTYVPITCYRNNAKSKINAAAFGGAECMINTIENFTDIEIDYWVKINFKGVIKLVDALGGIEVDVPYAFCESDSNRLFSPETTIYVEKGLQTLDGQKALAFARNRHPWPQYCPREYTRYTSNDFIRGQNQQKIINAMLNKLKNIRSFKEVYSILDVVGDSIDTNIDKETMITGFDTFTKLLANAKNITSDDFVGTQRLYLSGYDDYINKIYYYRYYEQSLEEIVNAMKINLELKIPEMDKEFDYSINEPYENLQIGKGTYRY